MIRVTVRLMEPGSTGAGVRVFPVDLEHGATLEGLVAKVLGNEAGAATQGRAVLHNGQSLPRATWPGRRLEEGDIVAIIPMLVGG